MCQIENLSFTEPPVKVCRLRFEKMSFEKQTLISRNSVGQDVASMLLSERLKGSQLKDSDLFRAYGRLPSHLVPQVMEVSLDDLDSKANLYDRGSNAYHGMDNVASVSRCCPCVGCMCSCHVDVRQMYPESDRPIDLYVAYLFVYELFNVPQNQQKYEILLDYLQEERIFDRSYIVSISTDTQKYNYTMTAFGGGRNTQSELERSEYDPTVL